MYNKLPFGFLQGVYVLFARLNVTSKCFFIQFNVIEFYPSIKEKNLKEGIVFAKQHMDIAEKNLRIVKYCRNSLLYHEMKHEKKNQRAALILRWEATMALKSVNLLEFIIYHSLHIFYHEKSVVYTGMMV